MQPNSKHQKDKIVEYLENKVIDEKREPNKQLLKRTQTQKFIWYLNNLFKDTNRTTIVRVPSNFPLAMRNSKTEIESIDTYANEICDKAMADEEKIILIKEYFKFKLNAHLDRKPVLINLTPFLIIIVVVYSVLVFGNYLVVGANISTLISVILGISAILGIIYKPFEEEKQFNVALSYKYCILVLERAEYKAKKIKEDTSK